MSERVTVWRVFVGADGEPRTQSAQGTKTEKMIRLDAGGIGQWQGTLRFGRDRVNYTELEAVEAFISDEARKAERSRMMAEMHEHHVTGARGLLYRLWKS